MNPRLKELLTQAGVSDNWNTSDWYSMSPEMVEKFAELVKKDHTREVVNLCATTIDANLRAEQQKKKNKRDLVEVFIISALLLAWSVWWYSIGHP